MNDLRSTNDYFQLLSLTVRSISSAAVDRIADELMHAYVAGGTVYVFGNGGSAATASHFACDLGKGTARWLDRSEKRFRVIALTDNVPLMTAWGNDSDYADIFAEQLRNLVRPGDVAFAISGSGNSPNVLRALEVARSAGAHTIGLAGFRGGEMKQLCDNWVIVPSENMEIIEDAHVCICHALAVLLRACITERICARDAVKQGIRVIPRMELCSSSRTETPAERQDNACVLHFTAPLSQNQPSICRETDSGSAEAD